MTNFSNFYVTANILLRFDYISVVQFKTIISIDGVYIATLQLQSPSITAAQCYLIFQVIFSFVWLM